MVSHAKTSMENKGKRKVISIKEEEEDISKLVLGIMEGYSDSTIPPLSLFKPGFSINDEVALEDYSSRKRVKNSENMREKDRRVKMNDSYSLLESIVPGLVPKFNLDEKISNLSSNLPNHYTMSTKDKVIQGTIEYIKYLEEEKNMLERLKESFLGPKVVSFLPCTPTATKSSDSATVTVCGRVCFFGIECQKRQGLLAQIFMVFNNHRAEVLAANISDNGGKLALTVTALFHGDESCTTIEEIKREILML